MVLIFSRVSPLVRWGHRGSSAQAMSAMGDVLLEQGDLPGASKMYQMASTVEQELGAKIIYASTLTQVGRVLRQQGKADEAQQSFRDSLSMEDRLGNTSDAAKTHLALAELDCDSGKGIEAEQLSRVAVETFRADAYTDEENLAQSMLSRAFFSKESSRRRAHPLPKPSGFHKRAGMSLCASR